MPRNNISNKLTFAVDHYRRRRLVIDNGDFLELSSNFTLPSAGRISKRKTDHLCYTFDYRINQPQEIWFDSFFSVNVTVYAEAVLICLSRLLLRLLSPVENPKARRHPPRRQRAKHLQQKGSRRLVFLRRPYLFLFPGGIASPRNANWMWLAR